MAVILCGCDGKIDSRIDLKGIRNHLMDKGESVSVERNLCKGGFNGALKNMKNVSRLVVGACSGLLKDDVKDALKRKGADPFAYTVVPLLGECCSERGLLLLTAAAERLKLFEGSHERNIRPRFGSVEGTMSRRQFLKIPKIQYDLVPSVDNERCRSLNRRCRACLGWCRNEALVLGGDGKAFIEKEKCSGCGVCVRACPSKAIIYPHFSQGEIMREIEVLLKRGDGSLEIRTILFSCESSGLMHPDFFPTGGCLPEGFLPVVVPCLGMLDSFCFVYAFALGASGIALLPCLKGGCCKGGNPERLLSEKDLANVLLGELGVEGQRIIYVETDSLSGVQKKLQEFSKKVQGFGTLPAFSIRGVTLRHDEYSLARLIGKITVKHFSVNGSQSIPIGKVFLENRASCTLCGVCAEYCPAGALRFVEGKSGELRFQYRNCIACGECVRRCPEKVLRMRRVIDTEELCRGNHRILAHESAICCTECGAPFMNEALFRKIRGGYSTTEADGVIKMCPDCRARNAFSDLFS